MAQLKDFLAETLDIERERLPLWIPVLIGTGIGCYYLWPYEPPLWPVVTCLAFLGTVIAVLPRFPLLRLSLLVLFLVPAGFVAAKFHAERLAAPMLEDRIGPVAMTGHVLSAQPLPENKGWRAILTNPEIERVSPEKTPRRVRLQIYAQAVDEEILPGMRISVLAVLNPPSPPVMPGAFDFRRHMFFQQIGGTGYILGPVKILDAQAQGRQWVVLQENLRSRVRRNIHDSFEGRPVTASLVSALLAGARDAITEETWESIRTAGLAHLLAISGLHIGLVAGFLFFFIRAALALSEKLTLHYPIKKIAAGAALAGTICYLLLVGAPVSAQRATMMTGVVLIAVMLDREGITMRLAALAATVILLLTPHALLNAGFQMSFAAVICLIAFYETISESWRRWYRQATAIHKSALYLLGTMLTTIVASLATAPFSLYHFYRVADEMSLLANLLAVPLTAFIVMPSGLLALLLMPFGLHYLPLQVMGLGVEMIYDVAHDITHRGEHMIYVPAWNLQGFLLMIFGGLWLCLWRSKIRFFGAVLIVAGCFSAWRAVPHMQPDIYVSDRGGLVAVRIDSENFAFSSLRRESFVAGQWVRRAGDGKKRLAWPDDGIIEKTGFSCDWSVCRWKKYGKNVMIVRNPAVFAKLCDGSAEKADILIAPRDHIPRHCPAVVKAGRFDLQNGGAHVFFIKADGIAVKNVAEQAGGRLWSPQRFSRQ